MGEYNKTIVSIIMGILMIIEQIWGIKIGVLNEESVTIILTVIWGLLVFFIPNTGPAQHAQRPSS